MEVTDAFRKHEHDFLLKEYEESFSNVIALESELLNIGKFYITFLVSLVAGFFGLLRVTGLNFSEPALYIFLSAMVLVMSYYCDRVNKNKADALWRYRKRLNVLRYMFIGESANPSIINYIDSGKNYSVKVQSPANSDAANEAIATVKMGFGETVRITLKGQTPSIYVFNDIIIKIFLAISILVLIASVALKLIAKT